VENNAWMTDWKDRKYFVFKFYLIKHRQSDSHCVGHAGIGLSCGQQLVQVGFWDWVSGLEKKYIFFLLALELDCRFRKYTVTCLFKK
jgi:hypothetical protein